MMRQGCKRAGECEAESAGLLIRQASCSHVPFKRNLIVELPSRRFCLRKIGSFAAAAADFGRLIALGHGTVRAFNSRAYCYASLGEFERAVADYTEAIRVCGC